MAKEQEVQEFESIFRLHYSRVAAYALRRTRTVHEAADVVADTFETAWRRRADISQQRDILPWLLATARRIMANQRRRDHNRSDVVRRMIRDFEGTMARQGAPVDEERLVVLEVFAALSPEDREVLGLFAWERLDNSEIADVMGLTPNATRVRLHRARTRLSQALRDAGIEVDVGTDGKAFQAPRTT